MKANKKAEVSQTRTQRKAAFMERLQYMQLRETPYFPFTNLPDTERLSFEMVNEHNYPAIYDLFRDDPSPFVIDEYKDWDKLEDYMDYQLYWNRNATKRASCDWLVQLKSTKATIGIVNLYELRRETFNDHHKRGFIGYNIAQQHRRQYYATEAVKQLIQYTHNQHNLNKLVAHLEKENTASRDFLLKLGFTNCTEEYYYSDKYDYYELVR